MSDISAALFQQMRFSILSTVLDGVDKSPFTDAYLFAWDRGVYPAFDEGADWHIPHADQFKIGEGKVDELAKFLDEKWLAKEPITFYEVESHFDVHGTTHSLGTWDRYELLSVCRYLYLHSHFDDAFWDTLLTNGDCPSEAFSIRSPMDRQSIYFN